LIALAPRGQAEWRQNHGTGRNKPPPLKKWPGCGAIFPVAWLRGKDSFYMTFFAYISKESKRANFIEIFFQIEAIRGFFRRNFNLGLRERR